MDTQKKLEIAKALSGISHSDWVDIQGIIEHSYHVTKKELTFEEISSKINGFPLHSDEGENNPKIKDPYQD